MSAAKHPKAIKYLFLTEMWERFSYYGISAILILYMAKTFGITNTQVYAIYGAYGALVYMTPLIGGHLADKYLGSFNAVVIGSILIAIGHFVVALRTLSDHYFYLGLAFTIVGTGLFSPNINAIVGHLYKANDNRRERGFTLAYMGRNIGTILAPIVCAWVAVNYDWRLAFILAGIGMLIGLNTFYRARKHFDARSFLSSTEPQLALKMTLGLGLLIAIIYYFIEHVTLVGPLLLATIVVMLLTLMVIARQEGRQEKRGMIAAFILTLFYIVFMILLQQSGGALNLFTDTYVDRHLFGFHIATGMFQSVEPLALVMLSPLYNFVWLQMESKQKEMSYGLKFVLGLALMSFSFVILAYAMSGATHAGLMSMHWLNLAYMFQAAGELFIGPIGLAMVSRLIPRNIMGLYMGVWVLASAIANFIAARIGAYITPHEAIGQQLSVLDKINMYQHAFWQLAAFGFMAALLLLCLMPFINKMAKGQAIYSKKKRMHNRKPHTEPM